MPVTAAIIKQKKIGTCLKKYNLSSCLYASIESKSRLNTIFEGILKNAPIGGNFIRCYFDFFVFKYFTVTVLRDHPEKQRAWEDLNSRPTAYSES